MKQHEKRTGRPAERSGCAEFAGREQQIEQIEVKEGIPKQIRRVRRALECVDDLDANEGCMANKGNQAKHECPSCGLL